MIPLIAAIGIAFGVTVLMITVFNYAAAPMGKDLGLTRSETATALSIHLAVLIPALPLAGALADWAGARIVILCSAIAYGLALAAIAYIPSSQTMLYLAFAAAGIAGAGVSPISYNRLIVHRFHRNRGFALGVALSGTGLGGIILPWIFQPIIAGQGWRHAFLLLALCATIAGLFAGFLAGSEPGSTERATPAGGTNLRQAMATSTFWQMGIAFGLLGVAIAAYMAQLTSIFIAKGLDAAAVPEFHATIGAATIIGRLTGGALMDRIPARYVGAGAASLGAFGLLLFAAGFDSGMGLFVISAAVGLCTGIESDVTSYLSSRYYGVRNFSRIYAVQGAIFMVGLAAGPVLGAIALIGIGVNGFLFSAAALLGLSSILLLVLKTPSIASVGEAND